MMPACCDFTVTSASGAGGSNRDASYACIARLPNFHHKIRGVFRVRQLRRVNLRGGRDCVDARLLFYAQVNASSLGQRERLKRPECALAEDGIDLTDHEIILTERCHVVDYS